MTSTKQPSLGFTFSGWMHIGVCRDLFGVWSSLRESQMERSMENDLETGIIHGGS